jgi:hypothetical protein
MWETNLIKIEESWFLLSFACKWLGEKRTTVKALPDYPSYLKNKKCDKLLCKDLAALLDEASIVVCHNGDKFDLPRCSSRILMHNLPRPSPFKTVDTLKICRKMFRFDSNKLDALCRQLDIGKKLPHTGFDLWERCMDGDPKAWAAMRRYNAHDVSPLLEGLYHRVKGWAPNHPNVDLIANRGSCQTCGSMRTQSRGFRYTKASKFRQFACLDCGAWSYGKAERRAA